MPSAKPFAGGLVLFAGITIGLTWGIANGRAMQGVLFGTIASAAVALLLWLGQRR
jgi:hypothetical protein